KICCSCSWLHFLKSWSLLKTRGDSKSHYAQFLKRNDEGEMKAQTWFEGYDSLFSQLNTQAKKVNTNPPARLKWFFEEAELREYMLPALIENKVASVWQP
ncbi:Tox-REase-5 domain-containing protein, partial [Burkholderia multivorans]|uniref:Tox-REase-5 domain-containing protein n=1 Tax=Burkholderia multivorans TaxID=87883 RepID=UPI0028709721